MNLAYSFATAQGGNAPDLPGSLRAEPRLSRWLRFSADGFVTVSPGKVEIGQGILTALAQIAADELDVALHRVRIAPASTPGSPNEGVTSGSLSVQESGTAIRHACAEARAIHLSLAAHHAGLDPAALRVVDGSFLAPDGGIAGSYWAQAATDLLEVEARGDVAPKAAAERHLAGSPVPRLDLPEKVFGQPRYLHDLRWPDMLHARMIRPPARAASLRALRDGPLPGDARPLRDGSFLAAIATEEWAAEAAATRLATRAEWELRESLPEENGLTAWLQSTPAQESVVTERQEPAPPAAHSITARFTRPFIAHASIGTCCAVALWREEALEVWTHSQGIYNLRADLATVLRLPPERIILHHAEAAGCYGHNGADDVALDAALCARAHPGRPVRALWSRAEELAWGPLSPAAMAEIEAGVDAEGRLCHWRTVLRGNGHSSRPGRAKDPTLLAAAHLDPPFTHPVAIDAPMAAGGGGQRNAVPGYEVPSLDVRMHRLLEMPLRSSALRALGGLLNVWAIESVMDELAERSGQDAVAFRLRHLAQDPRARAVLEDVARMCGWPRPPTGEGIGTGIAVARYKGTGAWCAVAAEVEAAEVVRCRRLWIAADIGEAINPDGAANQLEGGAIQATSIALKEAVRFDRLNVTSQSWDDYPILRFSEVPTVELRLMTRPEEPPLGAGEASLGPTIAAIAGGIHAALGIRPRAMPFTPDNLAASME
ncbi:molybdopterin cofactor-binding domain-containing protein [Pseudoroseomonas ludipueritiae]|uniref:Xanthine dehydrogenase family protein molybdopterin-binding subunit n=1 Tax=Pseudoroseomonas ludipueritiae TaxID=198093 RepID=A0ABR7R243_9PROT|nr:molybdopterin cofactor-binding domain-containing protein [Pseudoroseomonas ludipueritiae]MBC9175723.1 xanthine dehydrogenase family protein molybdopterin-binding subunit [Pseudoroseomonas ludipueritiae]